MKGDTPPTLEELKTIARMRQKARGETGAESMPIKSSPNLSAEAPSQIQRTISGKDWKAKISGLTKASKSIPGLNLLSLPFAAKDAQEQVPEDTWQGKLKRAGIMAGVPAEALPETEEEQKKRFEELTKRLNEA